MKKILKKSTAFALIIAILLSCMVQSVSASTQPKDTLSAGQTLYAGEFLRSSNGKYTAIMQGDGNFVIYHGTIATSNALFATNTHGNSGSRFTLQTDGNLVVYNQSNKAIWSPNIHGKGATRLVIQNDGNLVAYSSNGTPIWATMVVVGEKNTLFAGQTLRAGQSLTSSNGAYHAVMQADGNFVVYHGSIFTSNNASWSSKTHGNNNSYFIFQTDGNLVVYNQSNKAIWSPNIHGKGATRLLLTDDGNLIAFGVNNKVIWQSKGSDGLCNNCKNAISSHVGFLIADFAIGAAVAGPTFGVSLVASLFVAMGSTAYLWFGTLAKCPTCR